MLFKAAATIDFVPESSQNLWNWCYAKHFVMVTSEENLKERRIVQKTKDE